MRKEDIKDLFAALAKDRPDPRTELVYSNPYTLLVAVVLSAQATDVSVNKATQALFSVADTPEKMIALGLPGLKANIKTIGLFNTKAKNVIELSKILIRNHASQVPKTRAELEALPGVGHKTASVVLNEIFGECTIAVDTHVFRVANRTGLASGTTALEVEHKLEKIVPEPYRKGAHHWLILHGRYVCKARHPECHACPITRYCAYFKALTQTRPGTRSR